MASSVLMKLARRPAGGVHTAEILLLAEIAPAARALVLSAFLNILMLIRKLMG